MGKISREDALKLIEKYVRDANMKKHLLATEAVMRALAEKLGEDKEKWALTGLLHDIDYLETKNNFSRHGYRTVEIIKKEGYDLPDDMARAIIAHAGHPEAMPETLLEKALYAVDPLTGLIVASALIHPTKKLASIDVKFVMKRFKEKRFAAGADRNQIKSCQDFGVELEDFIELGLSAMQAISEELGL